jgi:hypothetical protein
MEQDEKMVSRMTREADRNLEVFVEMAMAGGGIDARFNGAALGDDLCLRYATTSTARTNLISVRSGIPRRPASRMTAIKPIWRSI